jgi:putative DNA methylase
MTCKRKLIELALPPEVINRESGLEDSIRLGHSSILHLWWSHRPLVTVWTLRLASLVNDPSSHPEKFPTDEAQRAERRHLLELIEENVLEATAPKTTTRSSVPCEHKVLHAATMARRSNATKSF